MSKGKKHKHLFISKNTSSRVDPPKFKTVDLLPTKRFAFTLAEVLITLGIIGVVAALTIPTLISNYQKKVTVTRLKETYAQLQQAVKLSVADNDDVSGWDFSKDDWFDKYLMNYIKGIKKNFLLSSDENSIPYKQISGARETELKLIKAGNGENISRYTFLNGVDLITTKSSGSVNVGFILDINGSGTKPNQFGKDTFYFVLFGEDGAVLPSGIRSTSECTIPDNADRNYYKNNNCPKYKYYCNKQGRGMWCGALIMKDNWEIRSDYPW